MLDKEGGALGEAAALATAPCLGRRVRDLGFRVQGFGSRVFKVSGLR